MSLKCCMIAESGRSVTLLTRNSGKTHRPGGRENLLPEKKNFKIMTLEK